MKLASVYGSAGPPGRLWSACELVNAHLRDSEFEVSSVSVRDIPAEWADGRPLAEYCDELRSAVAAVADADACLIFTPVYRASVPGPLKNLIDILPLAALEGKTVLLVSVGAGADHRLAVDNGLRHVLGWFGAVPMPTSVYLTNAQFNDKRPDEDAALLLRRAADSLVSFTRGVTGVTFEPRPLAAAWR